MVARFSVPFRTSPSPSPHLTSFPHPFSPVSTCPFPSAESFDCSDKKLERRIKISHNSLESLLRTRAFEGVELAGMSYSPTPETLRPWELFWLFKIDVDRSNVFSSCNAYIDKMFLPNYRGAPSYAQTFTRQPPIFTLSSFLPRSISSASFCPDSFNHYPHAVTGSGEGPIVNMVRWIEK